MDKNPMQAVIEEVSKTSQLSQEELRAAFTGIGELLKQRALAELRDLGPDAEKIANEFLAYSELILNYGTALIAIEDIEEAEISN